MAKTNQQRKVESGGIPAGFLLEIPDAKYSTGQICLMPVHLEKLRERGFTNEEIYRIVGPRRTLARRKELQQPLTPAESDRVLRLQRIYDMVERVFGSPEKAQRWLRKQNRALDLVRPIDLLMSETGAHVVEQELHRLDYGMLA
jgi:putative toxin-antitoxin system antitoxin component (TIGR02293 family)